MMNMVVMVDQMRMKMTKMVDDHRSDATARLSLGRRRAWEQRLVCSMSCRVVSGRVCVQSAADSETATRRRTWKKKDIQNTVNDRTNNEHIIMMRMGVSQINYLYKRNQGGEINVRVQ